MNYEQDVLYFKMHMLQLEVRMNGMIAENKQREVQGDAMAYMEKDFIALFDEYSVHENSFPCYRG